MRFRDQSHCPKDGSRRKKVASALVKDFDTMVLITGALVAYPAFLVVEQWLTTFAYFDNQFLRLFLLGVPIVIALCLSIVSFHTVRTYRISPVKFLKDE